MARTKIKTMLDQLKKDQYLDIDKVIINVINKQTKNTIISIDLFDYEDFQEFRDEYEADDDIDGDYYIEYDDEETNTFSPSILINEEYDEIRQEEVMEYATNDEGIITTNAKGEKIGAKVIKEVTETKTKEVVLNPEYLTEVTLVPSEYTESGYRESYTETYEVTYEGSAYYIYQQLREAFGLTRMEDAINDIESYANTVIGEPRIMNTAYNSPVYYTEAEAKSIREGAIKNSPNSFYRDGDYLYIGVYGDGVYESNRIVNQGTSDEYTEITAYIIDSDGEPHKEIFKKEDNSSIYGKQKILYFFHEIIEEDETLPYNGIGVAIAGTFGIQSHLAINTALKNTEYSNEFNYGYGYLFKYNSYSGNIGEVKQVRQGGKFIKYTQAEIDEIINQAEKDYADKKIDGSELNIYVKLEAGDIKSWNNISSSDQDNLYNDYNAKTQITKFTIKEYIDKLDQYEPTLHYYHVYKAYVRAMVIIMIELGYADWTKKQDRFKIVPDLDEFVAIELEKVTDTVEEAIDNGNKILQDFDKILNTWIYPKLNELQSRFINGNSIDNFIEHYWPAYLDKLKLNPADVFGATEVYQLFYIGNKNIGTATKYDISDGMFLYWMMMYQTYLFYIINYKNIQNILLQLIDYISFDQNEYEKFIKKNTYTKKIKSGDANKYDVVYEKTTTKKDKKGEEKTKTYMRGRKTNAFRKVNKGVKGMFKNHFMTYYYLIKNLFKLEDYVADKFIMTINKSFRKQIIEYEKIPKEMILTK